MSKILIVEDEKAISALVSFNLKKEGFETAEAYDGINGLDMALSGGFDLILLDVMLPGLDGFEILRKVRQKSNVPVIMVTAREEETDKILGLDTGADDYMTKPFSVRELVSRVKANIRRSASATAAMQAPADDNKKVFGPFAIDRNLQALYKNGVAIDLSQREYELICYFLETPDFPLLSEECDANYVLDSFIFGEYMSAKTLLESFFTISMPGEPLRRKQEDIDSAMCNMLSGFQRTAARNWFSLLESEHKRCANVLEGFWEKAREFKNGFQRSKKIQELFDRAIDVEWELRAWNKIDIYYQKMVGKVQPGVVNRNALIHGDYEDDVMDITDRDVIKIMLMWINMRLIADHFCYIEELFENRLTMVPYLCTLPQDLAIDIMSIM